MRKKIAYEELLRIIDLCRTVERRGADPFGVDIRATLEKLKTYLPHWELLDELLLDVEALNQLSAIVKLQGDWVRYRSSSLYIDPLLVELKIRMLEDHKLGEIYLESWHPIVALDQIFPKRLREALDYWNLLLPLEERFLEVPPISGELGRLSLEELVELKIFSATEFEDLLQRLWNELKSLGKVSYWYFVCAETFYETVERAYLTSFLVTECYAELETRPLEEEIYLIPKDKPEGVLSRKVSSVPIALDWDRWEKIRSQKYG